MKFKDDQEALAEIKEHIKLDDDFIEMRKKSKELRSLVLGHDFIEELINKIEGIESTKKAKARESYSRDIQDLFKRLFQPIDNIYYATGGVKDYSSVKENIKKEFLAKIANIRDNKPLSEWIQHNVIQLMNTDPNGLIFLEYTTLPTANIYPTYKSTSSIRYYEEKGQHVDYVIFEPEQIDNENEKLTDVAYYWRIVDDAIDRTFKQEGDTFTIVPDMTFAHPFGQVPAIICSNISNAGEDCKKSAIEGIIGSAKEYARDQSFLTLYKIYKGNPLFWRYISYCGDCNGRGKDNDDKSCKSCNGQGKMVSKNDVTDVIELPIPDDKESPVVAPNIAGFITPDLETWTKYEESLDKQEQQMYKSHWGTTYGMQNVQGMKTATEVTFDKQPLENQLNKYADNVEFHEWQLSEWILNFYDTVKAREESVITINLGRRYIIESYDVLLDRYEKSVAAQENSVVLDKLFLEYLGAKYRNNPIDLQINLVKAKVEPYLHYSIDTVAKIFGNKEAQRKILFQEFFKTVLDFQKEDKIKNDFEKWFAEKSKEFVSVVVN